MFRPLSAAATASLLALLAGAAAHPAAAQQPFCSRGAPAARCGGFMLTEFTFGPGATTASRRPPFIGDWELGAMKNTGPRSALGGTVVVNYDEDERAFLGVRPRYRRWVGARTAVDVSAGVLAVALNQNAELASRPALTVRVGVSFGDWIGLSAGMDRLSLGAPSQRRHEAAFLIGLRLGSYAGVAAWPLAAGLINLAQRIGD